MIGLIVKPCGRLADAEMYDVGSKLLNGVKSI